MITVAGEALIDLVGEPGTQTYRAKPGGSPANVAIAIARLRHPVRMLARLSTDPFGRRLHDHLIANDVDLSGSVDVDEPTSLAIASLDRSGRASYSFYLNGTADWQWSRDELPAQLDGSTTALHTGSLALALAPGAQALEDLMSAQRTATISIDLNLRPTILPDRERERARVERQLRVAHIVKASDEDLAWLYPGAPIDEIAAKWRAAGVSCVVVTLGAQGAYLLAPNGVAHRQTARPVEVIDTVGAGDAFTGGMLVALSAIGALGDSASERLAAVTAQQWLGVLDHAGEVAAITCGRLGADPPTLDELDSAI
jgi:fructokinase